MSIVTDLLKSKGHTFTEADVVVADAPPAVVPEGTVKPEAKQADAPPAGTPPAPPEGTVKPELPVLELDDEAVKKYLKEKRNITVDSLDDLKLPEKPLTEAEERENQEKIRQDAIKFAIKNDKFSTKELEAYTKDSQRTAEDIGAEILKAKWIKEDPTLTEEDLTSRFRSYFKLDEPEGSWERNSRASELEALAQRYFEVKYPKVVGSTQDYVQHLKDITDADKYNQRVERVFSSIPTELTFELDVPGSDGVTLEKGSYKFSYSPETIQEVKKQLLDTASFSEMRGKKEDTILLAARLALLEKESSKMVIAIAKEHGNKVLLANKAGRSSIPFQNRADGNNAAAEAIPAGGPAAAYMAEKKK